MFSSNFTTFRRFDGFQPIFSYILNGKFYNELKFAKEIVEQHSSLVMFSLDVDSLFPNIPLDETINVCTNIVYSERDVIQGINKEEFRSLLSLTTKESYFIFNESLYKQKDGVAVGSELGPTLANACLWFYD